MMLDDLRKSILIEDSLFINARHIVDCFIHKDSEILEILCLEKSPDKWQSLLGTKFKCKTYTDIHSFLNASHKKSTILIDSINQFALIESWKTTLNTLREWNKNDNINRFIIIMHTDCLIYEFEMTKQLQYICKTVITLNSIENVNQYNIRIQNVLSSGKVIKSPFVLSYNSNNCEWKCTKIEKTKEKRIVNEQTPETSFKIAIDENAELIKKNLILPYTEAIGNTTVNTIPDYEIDDWDDEDPDNDLNI